MTQPQPEICPFLAAANDPDSVFNYPSADNRCSKLGGQLPISSNYQLGYCLRTRHWFCPVFTGEVKKPPVPIRFEGPLSDSAKNIVLSGTPSTPRLDRLTTARPTTSNLGKMRLSYTGLLAMLLIVGLVGFGLGVGILRGGTGNTDQTPLVGATITSTLVVTLTSPGTATSTATNTPTNTVAAIASLTSTASDTATTAFTTSPTETIVFSPTASLTESSSATPSQAVTMTVTVQTSATGTLKPCTPPPNWQSYTVASGETYYKIAVKFNTTVEALQRINCLSDPGKLLAGQVIYVPPLPPTP